MSRLNQDRQKQLQPVRIDHAVKKIEQLGYSILSRNDTTITFTFRDHLITFYPYSGWHTGKTIKDGRGLDKLLEQIKPT